MSDPRPLVIVLGGGVSGLTSALVLQRSGRFRVQLWRRVRGMAPPNWVWEYPPYNVQPEAAAMRWARESFDEFSALATRRARYEASMAASTAAADRIGATRAPGDAHDGEVPPPVHMVPVITLKREAGTIVPNPGRKFLAARGPYLTGAAALRYCRDTIWAPLAGGARQQQGAGGRECPPYGDALVYVAPVVASAAYLHWLEDELKRLGGKIVKREAASMEEAVMAAAAAAGSSGALVVNCTGLAARELAPDTRVFGCRGHLLHVEAPWVGACVFPEDDEEAHCYIIACPGRPLELGGTAEDGAEERSAVSAARAVSMLEGNARVLPSLERTAELRALRRWQGQQSLDIPLSTPLPRPPPSRLQQLLPLTQEPPLELVPDSWVGIRPKREGGVRLELEWREGCPIIHNYGHGGSGMCCSYGCASEVLRMATGAVAESSSSGGGGGAAAAATGSSAKL